MAVSSELRLAAIKGLRRWARRVGVHLQRIDDTLMIQRLEKIRELGVDLVLDVGANTGQYVDELRASGYSGRIHSFEPIPAAFAQLERSRSLDGAWRGKNVAVGARTERASFRVSRNSVSSSLLDATEQCVSVDARVEQTSRIEVDVVRLDEIELEPFQNGFLKIDVQGLELDVLRGAGRLLDRVSVVECELSFVELYAGQPLFFEVAAFLSERGYTAVWFERGFQNEKREILQVDGLFVRRPPSRKGGNGVR